jgi:hypothetical protein
VNTSFKTIYDRFLGKITDDMYVELTPEDTLKDLKNLLIDSLPGFEFPRTPLLNNYTIDIVSKKRSEVTDGDFVIGIVWHELENDPFSLDAMLIAEGQGTGEEDEEVYVD